MNIVFASNKGYAQHLSVALCSLFENNRDAALDVYVINADIDEITWSVLNSIAARFGKQLIDVKISDRDLEGLVTPHHLTKETYYRLFMPEKISAAKVLYLDADIVVNGPISALYDTEVEGVYLAAVFSAGLKGHKDLEMSDDAKYFNAGVMVINLEKWRQDHIKERVIEVVSERPWAIQFADQCGLNSVVNGIWKELHPKFNLQSYLFEAAPNTYSAFFPDGDLEAAIQAPVIVHYSGSTKPWHFHYEHPYRKLYWKYRRHTPFSRRFSEDITALKLLKWCIPKRLKAAAKKILAGT
jgi:lipopolysaccharide biosynthesis glycosyltransferase